MCVLDDIHLRSVTAQTSPVSSKCSSGLSGICANVSPPATVAGMSFHDITMTSITGDQVNFADYEGKLALVVNVASA